MGNVPKPGGKNRSPDAAAQGSESGSSKCQPGDAVLVRRAQAGEMAAYEELVRRHQRRVLAIVGGILRRSEDIEDVAQQVFIKVFVSLKRFDLRSAFPTWLYKVTVNECWDYLRKKRARRLVYEADLSEEQAEKLGAEQHSQTETTGGADAARRTELRDLLHRMLSQLPEEEQLMMVLKEVEGFSVEEVAQMLGLNVNTVKVRLFRARGRLMAHYRKRLETRRKKHGGYRTEQKGTSDGV